MTSSQPAPIDLIPFTAPLSISEPSYLWFLKQSAKCVVPTTISLDDVPRVDLRGKWVLFTGANNGIGRESALDLAALGANLILACRDPPAHEIHPTRVVEECKEKAKEAGVNDSVIEWWQVDFAKLGSVEQLGKRWLEKNTPLDLLMNNAGVGTSPGNDQVFLTEDGFEFIHQINFLSHVLLTLILLPSLARAETPRIVCTTSSFHYNGRFDLANFNGELGRSGSGGVHFYQNNKLWFQVWLTELQRRLLLHDEYRHITVNGVHPGYVNSGIWSLNYQNGVFDGAFEFVLKTFAHLFAINCQQGSLALTHAAAAVECGPDPKVQGVGVEGGKGGGRFFNRIWELTAMPHTRDADCRLRVWRKVNEDLHLKEKGLLDVLGVWSTE